MSNPESKSLRGVIDSENNMCYREVIMRTPKFTKRMDKQFIAYFKSIAKTVYDSYMSELSKELANESSLSRFLASPLLYVVACRPDCCYPIARQFIQNVFDYTGEWNEISWPRAEKTCVICDAKIRYYDAKNQPICRARTPCRERLMESGLGKTEILRRTKKYMPWNYERYSKELDTEEFAERDRWYAAQWKRQRTSSSMAAPGAPKKSKKSAAT